MSKIDELKKEARDLGLNFSPNIGEEKLQEKIDLYREELEKEEKVPEAPVDVDSAAEGDELVDNMVQKAEVKKRTMGQRAREAEKAARKTRVIEIIDNDPRENTRTSAVPVTCANTYFNLGTLILPLNTPVEVMQGHINVLREVKYPHHLIDSATGLSKTTMRKRYTISYVDQQ